MNVFYEEDGAFKAGSILADNTTSLQVESTHGKRSKIKSAAVLLKFEKPGIAGFLEEAQRIAEGIDPDFLWECAPGEEFTFDLMAEEYFGHKPTALENAGALIRLHGSPMHFYKKGKGKYRAAPPDALKAALASVEKKRKLAELQASYVEKLKSFDLPEDFVPLVPSLLYDPEKASVAFKALSEACTETGLSAPILLEKCGAISSPHDYHLEKFMFEHFPKGLPDSQGAKPSEVSPLRRGDAIAFSIDDSGTTEIDDAFSVSELPGGNLQVGIHISAPSLGIEMGSDIDRHALSMLSTIYIPGRKYTMLPDSGIEAFTLSEGRYCPVVSLYLEVDPADGYAVRSSWNAVEEVLVEANLRHGPLERYFDSPDPSAPYAKELDVLLAFSAKLEEKRGKSGQQNHLDYNFEIENGRVIITTRKRGAPLDRIVSELMIYANTEWARMLSEGGVAAIYRSKNSGKVRQDTRAAPHQGLGVSQYAWTTSPLRRYIDLINQRQLVSLIGGTEPPYASGSDDLLVPMRNFDQAYDIYNDFQRTMERYWSLKWLIQEGISEMLGTVQRENWVSLDSVPLSVKVPSLPEMAGGSRVRLSIHDIDLYELDFHAKFLERA